MKKTVLSVLACGMLVSTPVFADGDAAAGEKVFKRCTACHTIEEGGRAKQGPNLHGVFGRTAGTSTDFGRYSDALASSGIVWSQETLTQWLEKPSDFVPGTRMTFRLSDEQDIADVIAYLKANSPDAE